jgi:hypothetical protein
MDFKPTEDNVIKFLDKLVKIKIITDKLGNPITVGCYIVYSCMDGEATALKTAKVLRINTRKVYKYQQNNDEETKTTFTVWSIEDNNPECHNFPMLSYSKATLDNHEKIIVIPKELLPESHLKLLELANDNTTFKKLGLPKRIRTYK